MRVVKNSYHGLLWIQILLICCYTTIQVSHTPSINKNLPKIIDAIEILPSKYQPANIKQSLTFMLEGGQIWKAISQYKFYNALFLSTISIDDARILQLALNSSDDIFWIQIHSDQKVHEAIKHCNIPFTRETSMMHEYKMLFRITYLRIHISNQETLKLIEQSYQHAVVALQWFLYAQAILQDSIFTSGIITVPDKEYALFHFLDGYGELVSPRYRFYSGLHPHSLWQPNAYSRASSNWPHKKLFHDTLFGIDFHDKDHNPLMILPNNNSHLMFCALDNNMTAIKWEEHGVTINLKNRTFSALKHSLKYLQTKRTDQRQRKDKVPHDVMLQFKSLLGSNLTKHQADLIAKDGISMMLGMLNNNARQLFIEFLTKHKKYVAQTLSMRKGDEIILQPNLFKSFSAA